jgi:hypothetical protein
MKDIYEMLNDVDINFNEYEEIRLDRPERKRIIKRIKNRNANARKGFSSLKVVAAAVLVCTCFYLGFSNTAILAKIAAVRSSIESYLGSNEGDLEDYKTVIGKTVQDQGITAKLNEVVLDDELILSSTFTSDKIDLGSIVPFPIVTVYINGKKYTSYSEGAKLDKTSMCYFTTVIPEGIKLDDNLKIKVVYNDIAEIYKKIKGNWSFEFTASGTKLKAEVKTININKSFKLDNGQVIKVENLRITPVSTKLFYKVSKGKKDVSFKLTDKIGNESILRTMSIKNDGEDGMFSKCNKYESLGRNTAELKILPYVAVGNIFGRTDVVYLEKDSFKAIIK